ncbi:MAG TPA: gas vesicle protein [Cytophagales bacterium]|jgi:gas vesicle protein|nr:gas vesicle protein [Cytophagales bacterium]
MNSNLKTLGGFIIGAAAGAAMGILLAPASGKRTRRKIVQRAEDVKDDLNDVIHESWDKAKREYNKKVDNYSKEGKKLVNEMLDSVK